MRATAEFDYNQWQAMNQPQLTSSGSAEADTPESVTEGGIDRLVQRFANLFGVSPDLKGHGIITETNVGGGTSLQNAAILKDRPGGMLAGIFRYFTRALPQSLSGNGVSASETSNQVTQLESAGESPGSLSPAIIAQVVGTLPAVGPREIPLEHLSCLRPSAAPEVGCENVRPEARIYAIM